MNQLIPLETVLGKIYRIRGQKKFSLIVNLLNYMAWRPIL